METIQTGAPNNTTMQNWRDILIGVGGCFATVTLNHVNALVAIAAGLMTTFYMGFKCWSEIIKPWLNRKNKSQ